MTPLPKLTTMEMHDVSQGQAKPAYAHQEFNTTNPAPG